MTRMPHSPFPAHAVAMPYVLDVLWAQPKMEIPKEHIGVSSVYFLVPSFDSSNGGSDVDRFYMVRNGVVFSSFPDVCAI